MLPRLVFAAAFPLVMAAAGSGPVQAQKRARRAPAGPRKSIEQRVDSVLALMTLEEKIGQLNQYTGDAETGPAVNNPAKLEHLRTGRVGSMLNVMGARRTHDIQAEALKSRLKIPLLFGLDVIHGYQVTFPIPLAEAASWDLAVFYAAKSTGRPAKNDQDTIYRSTYINQVPSPQYAFGHGLSYTTFKHDNLKLSQDKLGPGQSLTVTCTLTNTGRVAGEEVVQLYLHDLVASITRPVKELKDFQKVLLRSGETRTLTFTITPDKLAFYNEQMRWLPEPGEFELMLGSASDDIRLQQKFELLEK